MKRALIFVVSWLAGFGLMALLDELQFRAQVRLLCAEIDHELQH